MRLILHHIVPAILIGAIIAACSKVEETLPQPASSSDEPTGATLFSLRCRDCHKIGKQGGEAGPDLTAVGLKRNRRFLEQVIRDPAGVFPGTVMPRYETLSVRQVNSLVFYLITNR